MEFSRQEYWSGLPVPSPEDLSNPGIKPVSPALKADSLLTELQQYVNSELSDVQAGFRKGRGTRDQIANICWIIEKQASSRKTSTSVLLIMPKPLTVWITTNWKILQVMGIPDHLTCLLRNLYSGKRQQLEPDVEQQTDSKLGKEYVKAFTLDESEKEK